VTGAVAKKAEQTFAELSTLEMDSLDGVLRGMSRWGRERKRSRVARWRGMRN